MTSGILYRIEEEMKTEFAIVSIILKPFIIIIKCADLNLH